MHRECIQNLNIEHFTVDCSSGHVHKKDSLQHRFIDSQTLTSTYIALLAVVADKAVVDTTPHLAHLRVNPVCGSLICLWDRETLRHHHDKQHKHPPDFKSSP